MQKVVLKTGSSLIICSKKKRDYLPEKFTSNFKYKICLDHRIHSKLKQFLMYLPLLEQSSITEFHNNITDFSNIVMTHAESKRRSNDSETKIGTKFL